MSKPVESDSWGQSKTDEAADATKDSWESNVSSSLKNDDRKKSGSYKRTSQEQSGWGAAPKNKDSGGWGEGASSSNYEEVEKWGVTQSDNNDSGTSPANNKENKSNLETDKNDAGDTGNWNSTANEDADGWGARDDKGAENDNWATVDEKDEGWNPIEESDDSIKNTTNWVNNQQDYSNDYQRRDNRPRDRGRGGRERGERGRRGGRDRGRGRGRGHPPRDNYRRDYGGDNDYRSHRSYYSRGGGRNQNNEGMLIRFIKKNHIYTFFFFTDNIFL
jgi:hypothetical protein